MKFLNHLMLSALTILLLFAACGDDTVDVTVEVSIQGNVFLNLEGTESFLSGQIKICYDSPILNIPVKCIDSFTNESGAYHFVESITGAIANHDRGFVDVNINFSVRSINNQFFLPSSFTMKLGSAYYDEEDRYVRDFSATNVHFYAPAMAIGQDQGSQTQSLSQALSAEGVACDEYLNNIQQQSWYVGHTGSCTDEEQ